eukprot:9910056-Ditylum_brightwellii.AAC.1
MLRHFSRDMLLNMLFISRERSHFFGMSPASNWCCVLNAWHWHSARRENAMSCAPPLMPMPKLLDLRQARAKTGLSILTTTAVMYCQRPLPAPMDAHICPDCGEIWCNAAKGRSEEGKVSEDVGDVAVRAHSFTLFDFGKVFEEFFFRVIVEFAYMVVFLVGDCGVCAGGAWG